MVKVEEIVYTCSKERQKRNGWMRERKGSKKTRTGTLRQEENKNVSHLSDSIRILNRHIDNYDSHQTKQIPLPA